MGAGERQASLTSQTGKPKLLSAVRPNIGIELAYRRKLESLIDELNQSLIYWLRAAYKQNEPEALAMDRSPAAQMEAAIGKLARRWQVRFNALAPVLANHFARSAAARSEAGLRAAMRKAGFTVRFKLTAAANDALQAVINENVGLIKSIASEHLTDVQGILMRSVANGRDLGFMTKEIEARYGVTRRRAALIASDQNNKATAIIVRTRQRELGITEAVWMHSTAGKHPRPSHVKMNGGRYFVAEGMYDRDEGRKVLPGELINCRCVSRSLIPGLS